MFSILRYLQQANGCNIITMMKLFLIDAYNVIRHSPSLALFENRNGTPPTVKHFVELCKKAIPDAEHWIVVFDGPGDPQVIQGKNNKLEVLFSGEISADEIIIDKARYALAQGVITSIASTDFAVYEPGVEKISAYDFYDLLMTRPAAMQETSPGEITAPLIIDEMKKAGHLPATAKADRRLIAGIRKILEYYCETLSDKANKAARRIEQLLSESTTLSPSPDPEKEIQRKLKEILRR